MPYTAIKNHMKLMLRSKWIVIVSVVLPILVIATLIGAFDSMMKTNYKIEPFKAGYRIEENSGYASLIERIKAEVKEEDVILEEYPEGDIEELMKQSTVDVFVDIGSQEYTMYQSEEKKSEAAIVENIIYTGLYQYTEAALLLAGASSEAQKAASSANAPRDIQLKADTLKVDPLPPAADYYGIVEVVNFTFYLVVCVAMVFASERRNRIQIRLNVAPTSAVQQYLAKFIPAFLFSCAMALSMILSSHFLLDVQWGSELGSIGIMVLVVLTATAFNLLLLFALDNLALSLVVMWMVIYICGFVGGSYEMYMFASTPESIARLSPLYYMNRTLVEYSTQGYSSYTTGAVLWCAGITVMSVILTLLVIERKRRAA